MNQGTSGKSTWDTPQPAQTTALDAAGLNAALSESTCLGLAVAAEDRRVHLDLETLSLPAPTATETAPGTVTLPVRLTLHGVQRVAASLRMQRYDDLAPIVLPLQLAGLSDAVASFGGGRLYGREFVDIDDSGWALWSELLSFDTELDPRPAPHNLEFSQEEGLDPRELDVRVWFETLSVTDPAGQAIPVSDFIAGGKRWWTAHDAGDPRASHPAVMPPL